MEERLENKVPHEVNLGNLFVIFNALLWILNIISLLSTEFLQKTMQYKHDK